MDKRQIRNAPSGLLEARLEWLEGEVVSAEYLLESGDIERELEKRREKILSRRQARAA